MQTQRDREELVSFFSFIGKSGLHRYIDHNKNIDHEPESESQMDQQWCSMGTKSLYHLYEENQEEKDSKTVNSDSYSSCPRKYKRKKWRKNPLKMKKKENNPLKIKQKEEEPIKV